MRDSKKPGKSFWYIVTKNDRTIAAFKSKEDAEKSAEYHGAHVIRRKTSALSFGRSR